MSVICGKSGKENGLDVCYKLIDYFIDRNFLKMCSWTGNTREKDASGSKIAVKYFKNFRNCFLKVVRLADIEFSEQKCDIFLKRVLKNSTQRSNAKRILSTHKNRPKKNKNSREKQIEGHETGRNDNLGEVILDIESERYNNIEDEEDRWGEVESNNE